jgi:hypothetical protein
MTRAYIMGMTAGVFCVMFIINLVHGEHLASIIVGALFIGTLLADIGLLTNRRLSSLVRRKPKPEVAFLRNLVRPDEGASRKIP